MKLNRYERSNRMNKKLDDEIKVIKDEIDKIVLTYEIKELYNQISSLIIN